MRLSPALRAPILLLVLSVALLGSACTAMQHNAARDEFIRGEMQEYTFQKPLEEVWPTAREVLFENGYQTRDSDGSFTAETDWREEETKRTRYMLSGIKKSDATCSVHFTKDTEQLSSGSADTGRDYMLEWFLVQRLEPSRAVGIDEGAQAYADQKVPMD